MDAWWRSRYRSNASTRIDLRPWQTRTHCCQDKCFTVCPPVQHLLRTQILCPGHKKCFWFCSEAFCVRNKCFPVCAAHGQQCVRNNVSIFTRAFTAQSYTHQWGRTWRLGDNTTVDFSVAHGTFTGYAISIWEREKQRIKKVRSVVWRRSNYWQRFKIERIS